MNLEQPSKRVLPLASVEGDSHTARHNEYELDVYRLIHLTKELPIEEMDIKELDGSLDDLCWTDANDERVSPRAIIDVCKSVGHEQAIASHPEYTKHIHQIYQADYLYPILIFDNQVLDGMHRLAKASIDGQQSIKAKRINQIPEAAIITVHSEQGDTRS